MHSVHNRFYFVSDPTLLEILSLGSDPPSVVPHFQSGLFDSLSNVTFDKVDKTRMLEMFSQQGEKVRSSLRAGRTHTCLCRQRRETSQQRQQPCFFLRLTHCCVCHRAHRWSLSARWMPRATLSSGCSGWLMACRTQSSRCV